MKRSYHYRLVRSLISYPGVILGHLSTVLFANLHNREHRYPFGRWWDQEYAIRSFLPTTSEAYSHESRSLYFFDNFNLIRPSWGIRRSEISICDITLIRAARRPAKFRWRLGGLHAKCRRYETALDNSFRKAQSEYPRHPF